MGYQFKDTCFADLDSAKDAYFLTIQPVFVPNNLETESYYFLPYKHDGSWSLGRFGIFNGTVTSYAIHQPTFNNCASNEPLNYSDAAAAYSAAFVFVLMHWYIAKNGGLILNVIKRS